MEIGSIDSSSSKLKFEVYEKDSSGILSPKSVFGDTNVFKVQYNPSALDVTFVQDVSSKKEVGNTENTQTVLGKDDDVISFDLIFDTSLSQDQNHKYKSVKVKYINKLQLLVKSKDGPDLICRVSWGSIIDFKGILINLKVNYTMFSSGGVPLRARAQISFKKYNEAKKESQTPSTSTSTDENDKVVDAAESQDLTKIAEQQLGSPDKWKNVAEANNIDNPRLVEAGTKLVVPS